MLTIQSNLKIQDLETLSKTLIKPDIINFSLNKVGGGYTDKIADKVIAKLSKLDKDKIIVIINDITLQMVDKLLEAGYKNIYLAFGGFNKDGTVSKDKTVYNIMKAVIENNIKEKLNAISLEEIFNMKIDGIIANPPYGAIGANIVYTIREKVNYECFVNLLPANDYKRNKTKDLFNYQSEMEPVNDGFDDAAVTTHLCLVSKNKANSMTLDEFERSQYIDPSLDKYFEENSKRIGKTHNYYTNGGILTEAKANKADLFSDTTYLIGLRDINHRHLPYSKKIFNYRWNNSNNLDTAILLSNVSHGKGMYNIGWITFGTPVEKSNFAKFTYSNNGFRFLCKVFTSMNIDGTVTYDRVFPKVDWTRSWTVEEILKDYGYTEDEIKEVMADLDNFKGMDD